jgi:hypothetical protein
MNSLKTNSKLVLLTLTLALTFGQVRSWADSSPSTQEPFEVSLYTGIPGIGQLGETYKSITKNAKLPFTPIDITEDSELLKAGVVYGIAFQTVGAKVYFKRTGSCLIIVHPPFRGSIKSKKIQLFDMIKPAGLNWEDLLIKELGQPESEGTPGLFGGDIYYYSWGDIEVSRIGLRQLMLYRDRSISEYRRTVKTSWVKPFQKQF